MDGGVDAHGYGVRVFAGDLLVDLEKVAVSLADRITTETLDSIAKVEVDRQAGTYTTSFVTDVLGGAARYVTRHEVTERRINAL